MINVWMYIYVNEIHYLLNIWGLFNLSWADFVSIRQSMVYI